MVPGETISLLYPRNQYTELSHYRRKIPLTISVAVARGNLQTAIHLLLIVTHSPI